MKNASSGKDEGWEFLLGGDQLTEYRKIQKKSSLGLWYPECLTYILLRYTKIESWNMYVS